MHKTILAIGICLGAAGLCAEPVSRVVVTGQEVPVYSGQKKIATVGKGDVLKVSKKKGKWLGVPSLGGWIHEDQVRALSVQDTDERDTARSANAEALRLVKCSLRIPRDMPNYISDPDHETETHAVHKVKGVVFRGPTDGKVPPFSSVSTGGRMRTVAATLSELHQAYRDSSADRVLALYTAQSRKQLEKLFSNADARERFLKSMGATASMKILIAFECGDGLLAVVEVVQDGGTAMKLPYFLQQREGRWYLSSSVPSGPLAMNVMSYVGLGKPIGELITAE